MSSCSSGDQSEATGLNTEDRVPPSLIPLQYRDLAGFPCCSWTAASVDGVVDTVRAAITFDTTGVSVGSRTLSRPDAPDARHPHRPAPARRVGSRGLARRRRARAERPAAPGCRARRRARARALLLVLILLVEPLFEGLIPLVQARRNAGVVAEELLHPVVELVQFVVADGARVIQELLQH